MLVELICKKIKILEGFLNQRRDLFAAVFALEICTIIALMISKGFLLQILMILLGIVNTSVILLRVIIV
jgi:hypothetical protein